MITDPDDEPIDVLIAFETKMSLDELDVLLDRIEELLEELEPA